MQITRRDFLKFCTTSSAALALGPLDLLRLEQALANPDGPTVIWLQGASCTGCSISFLNRIATSAPATAADVLIDTIDLAYHPNVMAAAGESAVAVVQQTFDAGNYVLAVEGGVPTAFGGNTCWAWTENGRDVTFQEAVTRMASRAAAILCVGTCAAFGGVPAAGPNPTGVKGVGAALNRKTINIAGCPPHPDWIVWTIASLLSGSLGALDGSGRPAALYKDSVHSMCPRRGTRGATTYGQDLRCLKPLGCLGPRTKANCPTLGWNGGANWCVDANAMCIGCTEPTFPMLSLRDKAPGSYGPGSDWPQPEPGGDDVPKPAPEPHHRPKRRPKHEARARG